MPTPQSRPRFKPRPVIAAVPSFECSCGTVHHADDGQLPVGWSRSSGAVFCADCTRLGIPARRIRRSSQPSADKLRLRGEVIELLREGQTIMPLGSKARTNWVARVNALLAETGVAA